MTHDECRRRKIGQKMAVCNVATCVVFFSDVIPRLFAVHILASTALAVGYLQGAWGNRQASLMKRKQLSTVAAARVRAGFQTLTEQEVATQLERECQRDPSLRAKVLNAIRAGGFDEARAPLTVEDPPLPSSYHRVKQLPNKLLAAILTGFEVDRLNMHILGQIPFSNKRRLFMYAAGLTLDARLPAGQRTERSITAVCKNVYLQRGRVLQDFELTDTAEIDWDRQVRSWNNPTILS